MTDELRALVRRAQAGDATTLPRIRAILDSSPEIWGFVGDLAGVSERAWTAVLAGNDPLAVECMNRSVAEMKSDLAGDRPTRLIRMAVDQVVATYVETKFVETMAANPGRESLPQANVRLKKLESAQGRHAAALKYFSEVRAKEEARAVAPTKLRIFDPKRRRA